MATAFHPLASAGVSGSLSSSSAAAESGTIHSVSGILTVRAHDRSIAHPISCSVTPSSLSVKTLFASIPSSNARTISTNSGSSSGSVQGRECRKRSLVIVSSSDNGKQSGEVETSDANVDALEAKVGIGRRARKQKQGTTEVNTAEPEKPKEPAKTWETMSFPEKAWSLYIDPDKGVLFWINKLAYGAIFAVIGGWIVFRFIGPALGFYELDQQLLSPGRLLDDAP